MPASARIDAVTLEPEPSGWAASARAHFETPAAPRRAAREAFGLPPDRPVIASGHQAQVWHAGIAAKALAMHTVAQGVGAASLWIVVDTDDNAPGAFAWPTSRGGALARAETDLLGSAPERPVAARAPAMPPVDAVLADSALAGLDGGARRAIAAVRAHVDASSVAEQMTRAAFDLLDGHAGRPDLAPVSAIFASGAFDDVLEMLRSDPQRAHEAYNAAVRAHSDAGLLPLGSRPDRGVELPMWRLHEGNVRRRVFASDLERAEPAEIAPRALLMTLLVRLRLCDLFIHGTGGGVYDRATEAWARDWLDAPLAPMTVATADVRLPLHDEPVNEQDVAHAAWRAHHAAHHPADLGDDGAQRERDELVRRIERAPRRSAERADLYAQLHRLVAGARRAHRQRLEALEAEQRDTRRRLAERAVAEDRTWSIALLGPETIAALAERVRSEITPGG